MGIEFVRKAAPSFRKGLDRKRIELATPTLFSQTPACAPRAYAANLRQHQTLAVGDEVGVHLDGDAVLVLQGLSVVATLSKPTVELRDALIVSNGEACGVVQDVHDVARIVEITIC